MKKVSVIISVYNNEDNIRITYEDLYEKVLSNGKYEYEVVMVNDGSKDKSYEVMQEIAREHNNVKIISLSRNFGAHAADLCGLVNCTGDVAVTKASDNQEPSEMIVEMLEKWEEGNNVVLAVRKDREESLSQKINANLYYWMVRKTSLPNMPKNGFDQYLVDRKVIEVLAKLDEKNSAVTAQILWCGFKTAEVEYVRRAREIGKSGWTLKKKIKLVSDSLFGFSTVPIKFVSGVGVVSIVGSIVWAIVVMISKLKGEIVVNGWTTLFIFNLLSFGVIMFTLGVLGNYLWRAFDAIRNRPTYIKEQENVIEDRNE